MGFNVASLQSAINTNESLIQTYQTALIADAVNPLKTYSKDGESLSRNEWRDGIVKAIDNLREMNISLQKMINAFQPYIIRTVHRM